MRDEEVYGVRGLALRGLGLNHDVALNVDP